MAIAVAWILSTRIAVHLERRKTPAAMTEREGTSPVIVAILVPAPIVIILIIIIAPYFSPRYLYSSCPLVAIAAALSLDAWFRQTPKGQRRRNVVFATGTTVAALLLFCVVMGPMHLGDDEYAQRKTMAPYAADPCVYLIKRGYTDVGWANLSITADMLQLMEFEDVHVETDPASAGIAAYLASKGDPDEVVLYVDVYGPTTDRTDKGVAKEVAGRLGYSRCTHVKGYSGADDGHDSSETYLLER